MLKSLRNSRRFAAVAVASLALGLAGCSSEDAHEVEVDRMVITIGATEYTVNSAGVYVGPVTLQQGVATNVTVEFLDANLEDALAEHADEFQVEIDPAAGVTFTRTGPFSGTLTGTAAGDVVVSFALLHIEENHEDFGPFPVTITVTAPATAK